jgi:sulfoxide reductase heme-binding subunit YedZ
MQTIASRTVKHLLFFAGGAVFGAAAAVAAGANRLIDVLSFSTAYAGFLYISIALILAPAGLLRGKPLGLSSVLRRDFGIWSGVFALAHFVFGLQVHFGGKWRNYFFKPGAESPELALRFDAFGTANHLGLVAVIVFCVLLALSNNASVRKFGPALWKRLQQLAYPLFAILLIHGLIYQALEKRTLILNIVFGLIFAAAAIAQIAGFVRKRRAEKAGHAPSG